jgi:hypothetical protein
MAVHIHVSTPIPIETSANICAKTTTVHAYLSLIMVYANLIEAAQLLNQHAGDLWFAASSFTILKRYEANMVKNSRDQQYTVRWIGSQTSGPGVHS